jgi:hypothetical protein
MIEFSPAPADHPLPHHIKYDWNEHYWIRSVQAAKSFSLNLLRNSARGTLIRSLRIAIAFGFRSVCRMRTNPAFDALNPSRPLKSRRVAESLNDRTGH